MVEEVKRLLDERDGRMRGLEEATQTYLEYLVNGVNAAPVSPMMKREKKLKSNDEIRSELRKERQKNEELKEAKGKCERNVEAERNCVDLEVEIGEMEREYEDLLQEIARLRNRQRVLEELNRQRVERNAIMPRSDGHGGQAGDADGEAVAEEDGQGDATPEPEKRESLYEAHGDRTETFEVEVMSMGEHDEGNIVSMFLDTSDRVLAVDDGGWLTVRSPGSDTASISVKLDAGCECVTSDGGTAVCGLGNGNLVFVNLVSGSKDTYAVIKDKPVYCACIHCGDVLCGTSGYLIKRISMDGRKRERTSFRHKASVRCIASLSNKILVGDSRGVITAYTSDLKQATELEKSHVGDVCAIATGGNVFATLGRDRQIHIFDTYGKYMRTCETRTEFEVSKRATFTFSQENRYIHAGSSNGCVFEWDVLSGRFRGTWFSPDVREGINYVLSSNRTLIIGHTRKIEQWTKK